MHVGVFLFHCSPERVTACDPASRLSFYIHINPLPVSTWIQASSVFPVFFFSLNPFPSRVSSPAEPTSSGLFFSHSFSSQDQSRLYSHHSFDVRNVPDAARRGKWSKHGRTHVLLWLDLKPEPESLCAASAGGLRVTGEPRGLLGLLRNNAAQCLGSRGWSYGIAENSARYTNSSLHLFVCLFIVAGEEKTFWPWWPLAHIHTWCLFFPRGTSNNTLNFLD